MIISMLLPLLVIALVAGLGLLVMSLEVNSAFGQWILPSSGVVEATSGNADSLFA